MSEYLTNISVYETTQKVYIVGEDKEQEDCWRLLKIDRTNSPAAEDLSVNEDPVLYSWRELQSVLRCLDQGNISSGGLRKIAGPCPALVGACFSWAACPYLLLVTRIRTLGHIGSDNPIYGIDSTSLIPLSLPGETLPERIAAEEARARRLLSLVALTKDFFFSFSWPIWNTVQRTFASTTMENAAAIGIDDEEAFSNDRVWNEHLTRKLRASLGAGHSRWVVPLVHGFFEQKKLSLLGRPLLLTLIARRSCRFAGTRYRKRGVNDDGEVANDVEIEQIVELINSTTTSAPKMSSVVQVRGSVPLFWSQTWDTSTAAATAVLRPSIRMLHHLDPVYSATRKHFNDLRKRYGNPIQCLDLLRHGDSRGQESVLSGEYKNAILFLNKRLPVAQRIGYVHWDLRRHAKMLGSSLLTDLQKVQAPLLANTGIFTTCSPISPRSSAVPSSLSSLSSSHHQKESQRQQNGLVRTNCVDCLDRTNVAQFTYGLLAIGQQLHSLGLAPSGNSAVDPGSTLAAELMGMYEAMGHALAQQYGGSEAHTGFFKQQTTQLTGVGGDWQANLHLQGRDLLTSIKRFYSNAVTDEDKQAAINLFLGTYSPAMAAAETEKWGGWLRGRAVSSGELSDSGAASGSGGGIGRSNLLLAPETSLEDTAATDTSKTNISPSLFVQAGPVSPPESTMLLPSSLSTSSLASEFDGGADLSLPEILSSAVPSALNPSISEDGGSISEIDVSRSTAGDVYKGNTQSKQQRDGHQQQQQQKKRWPPRPPARTESSPLLASGFTGTYHRATTSSSTSGGLQSFDAMLPRDVRHVRLCSQQTNPALGGTKARPARSAAPAVQPPFAQGPPVATTSQLVRSNSTGNAPQFAFEAARSTNAAQQQQQSAAGNSRSTRDLRGNLVLVRPGETHTVSPYAINGQRVDAPVLPEGTSGYHTLAGLNLEGAPENFSTLPAPYSSGNLTTRPSTAGTSPMGLVPRAKKVSFASLSALRQFVRGGGGGDRDMSTTRSLDGGTSGYPSRIVSRSSSAVNLHASVSAPYNNSTSAHVVGLPQRPPVARATPSDLSWMYTQHQAVAHGLDDLGLPAQVAPLYRRGSNIVSCFVELGRQAAEQHAAQMAKLAMPNDPAEHRAAEQHAAALLRPDIVVTLPPGKAF